MVSRWIKLTVLTCALGACTDIVYRDRAPFNPPPDAASGFLGYFTAADRQTTCGNCHVGQQRDWVQTAHAAAWDSLQSSPYRDATCAGAGCHTVNWRGNQDSANVGYQKVQDLGYHDVQCESCHGPGLLHVQNPSIKANHPLASINVTDDPTLEDRSCSGCHRGGAGPDRHQNYLKEWKASRHGQLRLAQASNASCQPCHEAGGFLRTNVASTEYQELGSTTYMPQNCVVCHDPHGTAKDATTGLPLPGQLRFSIATPVLQDNLCTKCHGRTDRAAPTPTNNRGPHGIQGMVLLGEAGYFPPGSSYDTLAILTSHGSSRNPRLCAGCHVNTLSGVDAAGNTITFSGHTFHPLPCLQQKTPAEVVDTTYRNDCAFDAASRSWGACKKCHGDDATSVSRLSLIKAEVTGYVRTIWINSTKCVPVPPSTECVEAVDAFPADSGYLAKIKAALPAELSFANGTSVTAAKGAQFNVQVTGEGYASHPDGSHGVHNPFLYRALLQASIADLLATYPSILPAPPAPVLSKIQAAIRSGQLKVAPRTERVIMMSP